ncbi:MAG TPA: PqqD family peptide modification chaperone [Gemmatimonadaceae bacterium]|nr:PqqD family peptide modification chaperone [Gemmatimonadaceae bacterium]
MTIVGSMLSLSLDTAVRASQQQVSCDVADEAVLLSLRDGEYYGLNEVGASIWRLIQQPRTVLELRDALLEEYSDIESDECERRVVGFLTEMISLKLVDLV